jgi:hypothetical protein
MCYIDGQKNKYSVLNECNRMLKYNIANRAFEEFWVIKASILILAESNEKYYFLFVYCLPTLSISILRRGHDVSRHLLGST